MTTETTTTVPDGLIEVTTMGCTRRHYAPVGTFGHAGNIVCGQGHGYDQREIDYENERCGLKSVVIANLPLCGGCARSTKAQAEKAPAAAAAVPDGLVEIITMSARRKHYAHEGEADGRRGMYRDALCDADTRGTDQAGTDDERAQFGGKPVIVATLPLCRLCARKAAKLGGTS